MPVRVQQKGKRVGRRVKRPGRFRRRSVEPAREEPGREPWDAFGVVLNAILERTLPRHKTDFAMLEQHWLDVVGYDVASHTRPGAVRGNTLTVFVASSVWMQELQTRGTAAAILTAVRALLPGTPIERVRWRSDPGG